MSKICFKSGDQYGRLVILKEVAPTVRDDGKRNQITRQVLAKCHCGTTKTYNAYALRRGTTKSCGCLAVERLVKRNKKLQKWFLEGDICTLSLRQQVVTVDAQSLATVEGWTWHLGGNNARYVIGTKKRDVRVRLHRLLCDAPDGMVVDHINGNPLDNRLSNLRVCTQSQNMKNSFRAGASGYKGVVPTRNGRWDARITADGKLFYLGQFDSKHDAAMAYDKAALKYHGEYARLNFEDISL